MKLQEILTVKGTTVYTTPPEAKLAEVVREMVERNIGSMLVCRRDVTQGEVPIGILTERDVLRFCAAGRTDLSQVCVADVMTTRLITASPTTRLPT